MAQVTRVRERVRVRRRVARRKRKRRSLRWPLIAIAFLVVLGGLSLVPALAARRELTSGSGALADAQQALREGDVAGARSAFERAQGAFTRGRAHAGNPLLRLVGYLPIAGRTPDSVRLLAEIGADISLAGLRLTDGLSLLPEGISSLAPSGGRIPIDSIRNLSPAVRDARLLLEGAAATSRHLADDLVIGSVAGAVREVQRELSGAVRSVRAADALLVSLPSFAGEGGTRRYFVAAQNPAELRGTGGFIGVFSILEVRDGSLDLGPFRSISVLPNVAVPGIAPPSPEFAAIYDGFGGAVFWRNINMTPDAPTAGSMIERLYERVEGTRLDGTIFVDPGALEDLLGATGPVRVPALGRSLDADTIVPFVTNDVYFMYEDDTFRKRVLGIAAHAVLDRLLSGPPGRSAGTALLEAAADGHLVLHAVDPTVQDAFELAGVAGRLGPSPGDFLGLYLSNAAGNKVDFYVDREIRYEVTLGARGEGTATATVTFDNRAPGQEQPNEALGPYPGSGLGSGDNRSFVALYCASMCEHTAIASSDGPVPLNVRPERGLPMASTFETIPAGTEETLEYRLLLPRAWEGDRYGGTYRLLLQTQPGVQPAEVTVVVRVPAGMDIVRVSPEVQARHGEAVWQGTVEDRHELEVVFRRPFPARAWGRFWDFLTKPVIRL